jgi:hypothetical protein
MRLNKVLIAVLLLSVFAVGTLTFMDTVEAAKWKKFDSGNFNTKDPDPGYTKKISYSSYNKGSKYIKIDFYMYKTKNNKKEKAITSYITQSGNKIKYYQVGQKGKKSKPQYSEGTTKQFYNFFIKEMKKY